MGKTIKVPQVTLAQARANKWQTDWNAYRIPVPRFLGTHVLPNINLRQVVPFIDWMPFFNAWEFTGKFPDILDDPQRGAAARSLFDDARAMLDRLVGEQWLTARAVVGFFPANSLDDDIIVHSTARSSAPAVCIICASRRDAPTASGIYACRTSSHQSSPELRITSARSR